MHYVSLRQFAKWAQKTFGAVAKGNLICYSMEYVAKTERRMEI
jgi:hypothetical protein